MKNEQIHDTNLKEIVEIVRTKGCKPFSNEFKKIRMEYLTFVSVRVCECVASLALSLSPCVLFRAE